MKYYVVSDVHGFYSKLIAVLTDKGFFEDKQPRKLVICGDILDRGQEALKMQEFILDLMKKGEVILVRGNHEDLSLELLENASYYFKNEIKALRSHHASNGTIDTFKQLTGVSLSSMLKNTQSFVGKAKNTPYVQTIIPAMIDYFETKNYIFVHGWIPCREENSPYMGKCYFYEPNWRNASKKEWEKARWYNGMMCHNQCVLEDGKTIVCGHWHCSYGHEMYGVNRNNSRSKKEDFSPYYNKGIIAIDAATSYSGLMNCIVIEEETWKKYKPKSKI